MLVLLSWPTSFESILIYTSCIYIIQLRSSPLLLHEHVFVQVPQFTGTDTRPVRLDYTPFRVPAKETQRIILSRPWVFPTDHQLWNVAKTKKVTLLIDNLSRLHDMSYCNHRQFFFVTLHGYDMWSFKCREERRLEGDWRWAVWEDITVILLLTPSRFTFFRT
jgi:hypothetical protein